MTPWPGSGVHAAKVLANPRWEDFEYEYLGPVAEENMFAWMGDGMTEGQQYDTGTGDYLDNVKYPKIIDKTVDTGALPR